MLARFFFFCFESGMIVYLNNVRSVKAINVHWRFQDGASLKVRL